MKYYIVPPTVSLVRDYRMYKIDIQGQVRFRLKSNDSWRISSYDNLEELREDYPSVYEITEEDFQKELMLWELEK